MSRDATLFPVDGIRRDAVMSPCLTWRYTLTREWDDTPRIVVFVLLNPSTADATQDDRTNRRGIKFAQRWGYGGVVFVNLFAFRTPKPAVMKAAPDPIGPDNDRWILEWAEKAERVVVAWETDGSYRNRANEVLGMLSGFDLWCLRKTKHGHPEHPLYLRNDTELMRFP